jgi:uncharacterized membrane protein YfcA
LPAISAIDWPSLLALAVVTGGAGLLAGITAGLLGVGGGIVVVPVLFHMFGVLGIDETVRMHLAVGTSLSTIIPTSIVSARSHYRRGAVDVSLLRSWAPAIFVGAIIGTLIGGSVGGDVLTAVFAVVALAVTAHMALQPEGSRLRDGLPSGTARAALGSLIGGISVMMGIGGGTLSVPLLSLCGYPIRRAVGTAAAIGLVIAVPGTIGFVIAGHSVPHRPPASLGYVSLAGVAVLTPLTMLAAPWGATLAHKIPARALRKAFAVFLALTACRMLYGVL